MLFTAGGAQRNRQERAGPRWLRLTLRKAPHSVRAIAFGEFAHRCDDVPISRTTRSTVCASASSRDGHEPYRADQIAGWLYRRGVDDFERDDGPRGPAARAPRGVLGDPGPRDRGPRPVAGRHGQGHPARPRRGRDRIRADSGGGPDDALHLDTGRLFDGVQLLRHRVARVPPQPDDGRDRRPDLPHARRPWRRVAGSRTSSSWAWASRCSTCPR